MARQKAMFAALFLILTAACSFADPVWSGDFNFDGREITSNPITILPTDALAYSSALAEGEPVSLSITATYSEDQSVRETIFSDASGTAVEGTAVWNYKDESLPSRAYYDLTETIASDQGTRIFNRQVMILPEPAALLLLGIVGAFLMRRRAKFSLTVLLLSFLSAGSLKAESAVSSVSCLQMWPFDRSIVINYTITSDSAEDFTVKFYGSADHGATTFDLSDRGVIAKDGSDGTVSGTSPHKAIWTPDSTFYTTVGQVRIGVEIEEASGYKTYMVVDLSNNSISYLNNVPSGGWTDEYKTTKMVFRYVPAGTFTMGSPSDEVGRTTLSPREETLHQVTLTKPFYAGVFEVTQKQYELIMGSNPSKYKGDKRPVETVSYETIRGVNLGAKWPSGDNVDSTSFMGILRARTNLNFDLPTEAQWEYACRAGTITALNSGKNLVNGQTTDAAVDQNLSEVGRYGGNGGENGYHVIVGSYLPNAWGIYDMHGNVYEWCLDWLSNSMSSAPVTDPKGPTSGSPADDPERVLRGGCFKYGPYAARSAARGGFWPNTSYNAGGFRVFLVLE